MTESLSPGDFYLFCPGSSRGLLNLLGSFSRSQERTTDERIGTLIRQSSKEHPDKKLADTNGPLGAASWNSTPGTWRLGHGAVLVVSYGLFEAVGGHVHRVQPTVFYDEESNAACVFFGYLNNLDELIERYCEPPSLPYGSPRSVAALGRDPREAAAEVVYRMHSKGDDPLIMLSELQGQYSFVIYSGSKRQLFASRDSSGKEPLFYSISEDSGALSIANAQLAVRDPDSGMGNVDWEELQPGHFVMGGKGGGPKVRQFALTPEQLFAREYYDTLEDELGSPKTASGSSGRRSLSDEFSSLGISTE